MEMTSHVRDGVRVIELTGELDVFATEALRARLTPSAEHDRHVVDLGAVSFVDSAGLHALFSVGCTARELGAQLVYVVPHGSAVHRVVELVHLGDVCAVCATVDDAIARLEHVMGPTGVDAGATTAAERDR
ncbi:MAG: STAS domain-containing protein [Gaiella sp.]